jgi:hypothetical protein
VNNRACGSEPSPGTTSPLLDGRSLELLRAAAMESMKGCQRARPQLSTDELDSTSLEPDVDDPSRPRRTTEAEQSLTLLVSSKLQTFLPESEG